MRGTLHFRKILPKNAKLPRVKLKYSGFRYFNGKIQLYFTVKIGEKRVFAF